MSLIGKRLEALVAADLQSLIDDAVSENREIEFKEHVGTNDEAKREFLADVSSFANASGGDLLVGIRERKGIATSFTGLATTEADAEILRLESIIRDGLAPRIPGIEISPVATPEGDTVVLVIRVPRSFAAPHMVTFRNLSRFFSRNSAGKYQLDVAELRIAFSFADSVRTTLRSFRLERLARIVADDAQMALLPNPKVVFHLIPLTAVDPSAQIDTASLGKRRFDEFRPMYAYGWSTRINFDGALAFELARGEQVAVGYTQVFRNGAIEAIEASLLERGKADGEDLIPSLALEKAVIEAVELYLKLLANLSLSPPYLLGLTLLDVRGFRMAVDKSRYFESQDAIDRRDLVIPETVIEDDSADPATIAKPVIDAVWQATGWTGSTNYDGDGVWHYR